MRLTTHPIFDLLIRAGVNPALLPRMPRGKKTWQQRLLTGGGELDIQNAVEEYLHKTGRNFIRVPDLVYRLCAPTDNRLKRHEKGILSEHFKGIPDLLIPRVVNGLPYPMLLAIELKTATGTVSKNQKLVGAFLVFKKARNVDDAISEIERFFAWTPK